MKLLHSVHKPRECLADRVQAGWLKVSRWSIGREPSWLSHKSDSSKRRTLTLQIEHMCLLCLGNADLLRLHSANCKRLTTSHYALGTGQRRASWDRREPYSFEMFITRTRHVSGLPASAARQGPWPLSLFFEPLRAWQKQPWVKSAVGTPDLAPDPWKAPGVRGRPALGVPLSHLQSR